MLYVKMNDGRAVGVTTDYQTTGHENRNDWNTMERVETIARELTEATGVRYIGTDAGPHVSPRYDVIAAPVIGSEVSKEFNGDSYPEGTIVTISPTLKKIVTSTGVTFYRRRLSGQWIADRTWSMTRGHVSKWNPSF